jgi:FecR protein
VENSLAKRTFQGVAIFCVLAISLPICVRGAPHNRARITAIIHEVRLIPAEAASRSAVLEDKLREGTAVRTAADSRAELTFDNQVVARLNANALFTLKEKGDCDLILGAVLVQVPKGLTGAKIHAADVAVAISGATAVLEHQPTFFKLLVLEGTGRLYRPGHLGDSILVHPGQMVFGNPNAALSDPVDFDVDRFVRTCRLIRDFPPLQSERLIAAVCQQQQREKSRKTLIGTNLVIFGGGTTVTLVDPAKTDAPAPTVSDSASPSPNSTPAQTLAQVRR